jgi:Protein of unknown function (DUF3237)
MSITSQELPEVLTSVRTRPLFRLRETVPPLHVVGATPDAFRRIGVDVGGSFEGEPLSGTVVSGNDWQNVRRDNCTKLDVRLLLKTTDDALIVMTYQCLRAGTSSVLEQLGPRRTRRSCELLLPPCRVLRDRRPEIRLDQSDRRDRSRKSSRRWPALQCLRSPLTWAAITRTRCSAGSHQAAGGERLQGPGPGGSPPFSGMAAIGASAR